MRFWDEISQRLAALSGSATPEEARQALNEFDTRDIQAVRVSEGGGGNGGSSPFTLLGPFHVDYNDTDVGTGPVVLAALTPGDLVVSAHIIIGAQWETAPDSHAGFYVSVSLGESATNIIEYNHAGSSIVGGEPQLTNADGYSNWRAGALAQAESDLRFEAYPDGDAFTAGSCDVYAVIATP